MSFDGGGFSSGCRGGRFLFGYWRSRGEGALLMGGSGFLERCGCGG